jgi:PST family polysaccharide transporter/lipopolysaccharide exporter
MTTEVTSVVNTVAFPAYSRLQDDTSRLRRAYMSSLQFVAFLSFPMAAGLWFVGEDAVRVFLGERWLPALPAFYVLLIWGLIRSLLATTGPLFRAIGRPDTQTKIQVVQLVLLAVAIYPLTTSLGIVGAAWATVVAAIAPDAYALIAAARITGTGWADMARVIVVPAVQSALMFVALLGLQSLGLRGGAWMLVWATLAGAGLYLFMTWISRRWFAYASVGLLPRVRPSIASSPSPVDESGDRNS